MSRRAEWKQYRRRDDLVRNCLGCALGQFGSFPGSAMSFSRDLGKVS